MPKHPQQTKPRTTTEFGKIESHHLYLCYYPYNLNRSQIDANGIGQIEIEFETKGPGLEVTKCRACWVYEQDIEFVILISASFPILDTMKLLRRNYGIVWIKEDMCNS